MSGSAGRGTSPVWGYAGAAGLAALVFFNLGLLALLLSPLAIALHAWAAAGSDPVAASHQRFLLRTWLYTALLHLGLYASLFWGLVAAFDLLDVALQAEAAAAPGERLETVLRSLHAVLMANEGARLWSLLGWVALHLVAALLIFVWLSVRLIRRWLRWSDGLPA